MTRAEHEIVLPDRARAQAVDEVGVILAARTLIAENCCGYGAASRVACELIVTTNGVYDAALTRRVREGR